MTAKSGQSRHHVPVLGTTFEIGRYFNMSGKEESTIFKWDVVSSVLFSERRMATWRSPFFKFTTSNKNIVCGRVFSITSDDPIWNRFAYFSILANIHCEHTLINVELMVCISGHAIARQSKISDDPLGLIFEKVKLHPLFSTDEEIVTIQVEFKEINKVTLTGTICECLHSVKEIKVDSIYEKLLFDESTHDIKLIVGDKQYPAHKAVLAANSPVFHRLFSHQTKETLSKEVDIKEMDPEVLEELLKYMYTRKVDKFENLAGELLRAANRYEMEEFKLICERELMKGLNVENVLKFVILADTHNAVNLKKHGFSILMSNFAKVVEKDEFKDFANSHPNVLVELNRAMAANYM